MTEELKQEIEQAIQDKAVLLFVKGTAEMPRCGFSAAVIEVFRDLEVPFTCVDVLPHPAIRRTVSEITGWPTIPQVFVGGEFLGGGDVVREMHTAGELKPLVDRALSGD
ncbi:MAG: glutaredoxin family protein [Planctomycetota bacterium]